MKSFLKTSSLVFAVGFSGVLLAQFAGADVSASATPGYLFFGLFTSLLLLTMFSDYSRPIRHPACLTTRPDPLATVTPLRDSSSPHRLVA